MRKSIAKRRGAIGCGLVLAAACAFAAPPIDGGWAFALPAGFGADVRLAAALNEQVMPERASPALGVDRYAARWGRTLYLADRWMIEANVARQPGVPSRPSMASVWRPAAAQSVYFQIAAEESGIANAVGMRWWLESRRAVLDVGVRRGRDGASIEPRINLQLLEFAR